MDRGGAKSGAGGAESCSSFFLRAMFVPSRRLGGLQNTGQRQVPTG